MKIKDKLLCTILVLILIMLGMLFLMKADKPAKPYGVSVITFDGGGDDLVSNGKYDFLHGPTDNYIPLVCNGELCDGNLGHYEIRFNSKALVIPWIDISMVETLPFMINSVKCEIQIRFVK